jgi:hypothetical protein
VGGKRNKVGKGQKGDRRGGKEKGFPEKNRDVTLKRPHK